MKFFLYQNVENYYTQYWFPINLYKFDYRHPITKNSKTFLGKFNEKDT